MKINIEGLLNIMNESDEATKDYHRCVKRKSTCDTCAKYEAWKKDYDYFYNADEKARNAVWALFTVLNITDEKAVKARIANRSLRKWYEKTKWQK